MLTPKIIFIFAFTCMALGAGLVIPGIYYYLSEESYIRQSTMITCRITDINEPKEGYAYITFEDVSGKYPPFVYLERYDAFDNTLEYHKNEVYEINYNTASPENSKISNYFSLHPVSSPLLIMGGPVLLITPLIFIGGFSARKKKKHLIN